jgi:hypothetical protein
MAVRLVVAVVLHVATAAALRVPVAASVMAMAAVSVKIAAAAVLARRVTANHVQVLHHAVRIAVNRLSDPRLMIYTEPPLIGGFFSPVSGGPDEIEVCNS